ncbi:MAG: hypothetical protein JXJ19_01310 [Elusimicrobia bacterium]|nr:hypothetical protein [Elusimicrobiota bacterium]
MKKFLYHIPFILSLMSGGCLTVQDYPLNSELISATIDKTAQDIYMQGKEHIKKNKRILISDLDASRPQFSGDRYNTMLEDALILVFTENQITVMEKDSSMMNTLGTYTAEKNRTPDYILSYRLLECAVKYGKSADLSSVERTASAVVNLRLVDAKSGDIVWATKIEEAQKDIVEKKAIRKLEQDYTEINELNVMPANRGDITSVSDMKSSVPGKPSGMSVWAAFGAGLAEWESENMILEGGIGYDIVPRFSGHFNVMYYPYILVREGEFDEEFTGQVIAGYLSGEVDILDKPVTPFISGGFGMYIYIGDVDVPEYENETAWYRVYGASFSGSEISFGMNSGAGLKVILDEGVEMKISARYHYTGYEFGKNLQIFSLGVNYNF